MQSQCIRHSDPHHSRCSLSAFLRFLCGRHHGCTMHACMQLLQSATLSHCPRLRTAMASSSHGEPAGVGAGAAVQRDADDDNPLELGGCGHPTPFSCTRTVISNVICMVQTRSLLCCCVTQPVWLGWLEWARGCRTDAGAQASLQWLWRGCSTSSSAARDSFHLPSLHMHRGRHGRSG